MSTETEHLFTLRLRRDGDRARPEACPTDGMSRHELLGLAAALKAARPLLLATGPEHHAAEPSSSDNARTPRFPTNTAFPSYTPPT